MERRDVERFAMTAWALIVYVLLITVLPVVMPVWLVLTIGVPAAAGLLYAVYLELS